MIQLNKIERKILAMLVDEFLQHGTREEYLVFGGTDLGWLASQLGFDLAHDKPPAVLVGMIKRLEENGLAKYVVKIPSQSCATPTGEGQAMVRYIRLPFYRKFGFHLVAHWPQILVAIITSFVTTLITLGLTAIVSRILFQSPSA